MIARLLKGLLLAQLLAVCAVCYLAARHWNVTGFGAGALLAMAALALLLAVRALIVLNNFWLSRRYGSATPAPYQLSAWRRARLFGREYAATLYMSSWGMVWPRLCPVAPSMPGQAAGWPLLPVLLVHGYVCNRGYWARLSTLLAQAGIVHDALDLEPVNAGIDDFVPLVARAVDALCARTGSAQVVIVAHSMGGLVARAYLNLHGAARIAHVITLGTPHDGTALAGFGLGANARQMSRANGRPSAWLAQLAASETPQRRALFTSIWSYHDNIVAPQTSAQLDGARNLAFGGVAHVSLARDPIILQCVIEELTQHCWRE